MELILLHIQLDIWSEHDLISIDQFGMWWIELIFQRESWNSIESGSSRYLVNNW